MRPLGCAGVKGSMSYKMYQECVRHHEEYNVVSSYLDLHLEHYYLHCIDCFPLLQNVLLFLFILSCYVAFLPMIIHYINHMSSKNYIYIYIYKAEIKLEIVIHKKNRYQNTFWFITDQLVTFYDLQEIQP